MPYLEITTVGEITFSNRMKTEEGYRYDIPFDNVMLPFIPIAEDIRKKGLIADDVKVGFAHPEGYRGLCLMAGELAFSQPGLVGFIKRYFTTERVLKEEGVRIRSIRPGQRFYAYISIPAKYRDETEKKLTGRKVIGTCADGITGEVELRIVSRSDNPNDRVELSGLKHYVSLDYSATLLTPACFPAPFSETDKTHSYIPGAVISELLHTYIREAEPEEYAVLRCSNAYIGRKGKRFRPVPACASVVKLDKGQLLYRLAQGKDPARIEQDVPLANCYGEDFEGRSLQFTIPEIERIATESGETLDALTMGQSFHGRIYGSDAMIRKIVSSFERHPFVFLGDLTKEGYGEAYLHVKGVNEEEIPAEMPATSFDVCCASDVFMLNDDGMACCRAEDLLKELEYVLDCPGRLEIGERYTNITKDHSDNRPVVRCMEKGSVLRVRTKDHLPVDIFALKNCFVGERTRDGYGELYAYPARGEYYRLAENVAPSLYEREYPLSLREMALGAVFARDVLRMISKSRIEALAFADRGEGTVSAEELLPVEVLAYMKDHFDPTLSDETLIRWYRNALEGKDDDNLN
ncbi:MAG: hypothetical protein IKO32_11360 [Lachnospiraceae bacterium]|nr:hypothetical protein [Lachnospiraceae bacterium]